MLQFCSVPVTCTVSWVVSAICLVVAVIFEAIYAGSDGPRAGAPTLACSFLSSFCHLVCCVGLIPDCRNEYVSGGKVKAKPSSYLQALFLPVLPVLGMPLGPLLPSFCFFFVEHHTGWSLVFLGEVVDTLAAAACLFVTRLHVVKNPEVDWKDENARLRYFLAVTNFIGIIRYYALSLRLASVSPEKMGTHVFYDTFLLTLTLCSWKILFLRELLQWSITIRERNRQADRTAPNLLKNQIPKKVGEPKHPKCPRLSAESSTACQRNSPRLVEPRSQNWLHLSLQQSFALLLRIEV